MNPHPNLRQEHPKTQYLTLNHTNVIPSIDEPIDESVKNAWGTITNSDPRETIMVSDTPESRHYR
mgnify:CR=1 FL=1